MAYRLVHGDKDLYYVAWRKLNHPYSIAGNKSELAGRAESKIIFYQHDFDGRRIFQHCHHPKWSFAPWTPVPGFLFEKECTSFVNELSKLLSR